MADGLSDFDGQLTRASRTSPWEDGSFVPDLCLFRDLLSRPLAAGDSQESGRPAKAFDAWVASELRRAGYPEDAVWPRARRPRVLPADLVELERAIEDIWSAAKGLPRPAKQTAAYGQLRDAIRTAQRHLPGHPTTKILGEFYEKQIDVAISDWRGGPDVLISTKTMFSAYRKNLRNRHEEAVGEVFSLRRRHPRAVMGFAYLVRANIFQETGAYEVLLDILTRLCSRGELFDATMLLVVDWTDAASTSEVVSDPLSNPADSGRCPTARGREAGGRRQDGIGGVPLRGSVAGWQRYAAIDGVRGRQHRAIEVAVWSPRLDALAPSAFFAAIVAESLARKPVSEHLAVRQLRDPAQFAGLRPEDLKTDDPDDVGAETV